jgi:Putative MetA-pathway of phenol degradation
MLRRLSATFLGLSTPESYSCDGFVEQTITTSAIALCAQFAFANADSSAASTGHDQPWVGTFDAGLIYQVTPNFSVDVNSFFGLTDSAPDYNVFTGFGYRF